MADCPWYETAVHTGDVYGECDDACKVYSCGKQNMIYETFCYFVCLSVCAEPCSDEVMPSCAPEDKLKSWTFDDDCGNTCKQYECSKCHTLNVLYQICYA